MLVAGMVLPDENTCCVLFCFALLWVWCEMAQSDVLAQTVIADLRVIVARSLTLC
jgi:hypothetical protein